MRRSTRLLLAVVVLALPSSAGAQRTPLDIQIFAEIGEPGQPEGLAQVGSEIFVGTHSDAAGSSSERSKLFVHDTDGTLIDTATIQSQDRSATHGILGMTIDSAPHLYVLDRSPPRLLKIDPANPQLQQTYATFRDVAPCALGGTPGDCSAGLLDLGAFPDYLVFGPDGTLYITDLEQALIWRVPRGDPEASGIEAEVWFTDARLEGAFGPNGIQFMPDAFGNPDPTRLLLAQTGSQPPGTTDPGNGVLYTLEVNPDGSAGDLTPFWTGNPVDGPDGFAIAESGNVYVALAGANQLLKLSPSGEELARVPATPAENALLPVPFDTPASVLFEGQRLLMTNQSFFAGNPDSWVVYDIWAGEDGLPFFVPLPEPGSAAGLGLGALLLAALRRRSGT